MLKKFLKDLNEEPDSDYDLQAFNENDLTSYFGDESKEEIFTVKWDYDEPIMVYKIETCDILMHNCHINPHPRCD
jgi:hypothetical protein